MDRYDSPSDKAYVLGATLVFKGELTASADLLLQGRQGKVEGDVRATEWILVEVSANARQSLCAAREPEGRREIPQQHRHADGERERGRHAAPAESGG